MSWEKRWLNSALKLEVLVAFTIYAERKLTVQPLLHIMWHLIILCISFETGKDIKASLWQGYFFAMMQQGKNATFGFHLSREAGELLHFF